MTKKNMRRAVAMGLAAGCLFSTLPWMPSVRAEGNADKPLVDSPAPGNEGQKAEVEKILRTNITKIPTPDFYLIFNQEMAPYMEGERSGPTVYFRPDREITRGEMAVILVRLMGQQAPATKRFPNTWTKETLRNKVFFEYIVGDEFGHRHLERGMTMQELCAILCRMFAYRPLGGNIYGGPVTWATGFVQKAYAEGWLGDMKEVRPTSILTRAQATRILNRAFGRVPVEGKATPEFPDVDVLHKYAADIRLATGYAVQRTAEPAGN